MDDDDLLCGHKAYYPLDNEGIMLLVEELDMKKSELLKKLKQYNFLYLTESSVGYQSTVRITVEFEGEIDTRTEWRYCLLRLGYLANQ